MIDRHAHMLALLHSHGGTLLSALTPSSWMLLAPPVAAGELKSQPGVCMVREGNTTILWLEPGSCTASTSVPLVSELFVHDAIRMYWHHS